MALSKHSLLNVVIFFITFFRTGTMLGFPTICFSLLSLLHLVWGRVIYNGNNGNNEKQNTFFLNCQWDIFGISFVVANPLVLWCVFVDFPCSCMVSKNYSLLLHNLICITDFRCITNIGNCFIPRIQHNFLTTYIVWLAAIYYPLYVLHCSFCLFQ